jgi:hypothetical protein
LRFVFVFRILICKQVYEETKEKFDATETLANQMVEEFELMKERCMEQEEKKKSTNHFIEQKEAELQGLEVALVKVGADVEIEERKIKPLNELVTEANATSARIKSQIQNTLTEIETTTRKLNEKSERIMANIRDSLLRGYAICSHLRAASKPDALEQVILAQLTDPQTHRLLEGIRGEREGKREASGEGKERKGGKGMGERDKRSHGP